MRKIWNKGHRIRASDKHLVYHFSIGMLLVVFVAVLLLLNIKQLMRTDWEHFSLLENGLTLSPYNFITILIATGVCALVAFLYYRFCYDSFKKLLHRQKLATASFKALSCETRRKIIYLLRSKCLCAGDIAKHFELTGATISHHLKVLAEGNLITSKKVGLEIYYSLNIEKYNVLIRWFQFLNDTENFKEKGIK